MKTRRSTFLFLAFLFLQVQAFAQITDSLINLPQSGTLDTISIVNQAIADAKMHYLPTKSDAWKVGISTAVVTPVLGAIPAVLYASKLPNEQQLHYPDGEYSQSNIYRFNYLQQAQKMKRNRILKAYIAGTCVSVAIIGVSVSLISFMSSPMNLDLGGFH